MKRPLYIALWVLICSVPLMANSLLSIQNEFVKIIVNNETNDTGRFAVETTTGDPKNLKDDQAPLIYGRPKPWTSYTTIRIDDTDYVFGGPTRKRAGKSAAFGEVVSQKSQGDAIVTQCRYGAVRVFQTVSFVRNPLTRVRDTALISYEVINDDVVSHKVGVRIMMDTMLGSNDGAPFRIGINAIDSEARFSGNELMDYWQAFDDLTNPAIIAQGALKLSEAEITPPDRMYLVNWGTLADNPWDFDYTQGRSFIRLGETEKDTALSLFWDPETLAPKAARVIRTGYGLGGMSVSNGTLSLGLAAPAEVNAISKTELLLMGYVINTSSYDSKNTVATFRLPPGFKTVHDGALDRQIGTIPAGSSRQVALRIVPANPEPGNHQIEFSVISDTLDPNQIKRTIEVLAPPKLRLSLEVNKKAFKPENPYVDVTLSVANPSGFIIRNIQASLIPGLGVGQPWFEVTDKKIKTLQSQQSAQLTWRLKITNLKKEQFQFRAQVDSPLTPAQEVSHSFELTESRPTLGLAYNIVPTKNAYFYTRFKGKLPFTATENVVITYNPDSVKLIRHSPVRYPIVTSENGTIRVAIGQSTSSVLPKLKFHFRALSPGKTSMGLTVATKSESFPFTIKTLEDAQ